MTTQDQISSAITKAKEISFTWADKFLVDIGNGDDPNQCCEIKLYIIGTWIWILEDYLVYNFDDNGSIPPEYTCLSIEEIYLIISKINAIQC